MINFKKNLLANITLVAVLFCTFVHLLVITLNVFSVTKIDFYDGFNYLVAYLLIIISLAIFILGFIITQKTNIKLPNWFQVVFYVAFFLFTNTYYITNAYSNVFAVIFLFSYLSFISTIINVSIFYNVQKDEKNKLIASKKYIVTSIFYYSLGTNAIIELLVSAVKAFIFPNFVFSCLASFIVEFCAMLMVTIIICFSFSVSLGRTKRWINNCLIKVNR